MPPTANRRAVRRSTGLAAGATVLAGALADTAMPAGARTPVTDTRYAGESREAMKRVAALATASLFLLPGYGNEEQATLVPESTAEAAAATTSSTSTTMSPTTTTSSPTTATSPPTRVEDGSAALAFYRATESTCASHAAATSNTPLEPSRFAGARVDRQASPGVWLISDGMRDQLLVDRNEGVIYGVDGPDGLLPLRYEFGCPPELYLGPAND